MRKPAFRISVAQLTKFVISSLLPSSVAVQPGLCWTLLETRLLETCDRFSRDETQMILFSFRD